MIEKKATGKITLVRPHEGGQFTLDALEEFVNEARMGGVSSEQTLWFGKDRNGWVENLHFNTTDQFVVQSAGKQIVYKKHPGVVVLAVVLAILLAVSLFF